MEIFKIFGSVFLKSDEADRSLDKMDKKGKGVGATLGSMVGKAALVGGAVSAGVGAAGAALLSLANKAAATADEIDKLSERTGINREELQRWKYAAGQSGADIGSLEVGMKKLSGVMDDASNGNKKAVAAFEKLGISVDDLKNKSQEDIFSTLMTGLGDMEQGAERNALGADLLGKSYTEMLPLLNAGGEGMTQLKNRADELGLVMSEEGVKAGVVFGDTMDDVKQVFGAIVTQVGIKVIPIFQTFLNFILQHMPEIEATVKVAFDAVSVAMDWVTQNVFPPLSQAFKYISDEIIPIFAAKFQEWMPVIMDIMWGLWDVIKIVINHIKTNFEIAWPLIKDIVMASIKIIVGVVDGLIKVLRGVIDFVAGVMTGDWDRAWKGLKGIFEGVWIAIKASFEGSINGIIAGINHFIRFISKIKIKVPEVNIPLVGKVGGFSIGLPKIDEIPFLAEGGDIIKRGSVLVGENGPEILNLPEGAQVEPLGKKGITLNFYDTKLFNDRDADRFGNIIVNRLKGLGVNPA